LTRLVKIFPSPDSPDSGAAGSSGGGGEPQKKRRRRRGGRGRGGRGRTNNAPQQESAPPTEEAPSETPTLSGGPAGDAPPESDAQAPHKRRRRGRRGGRRHRAGSNGGGNQQTAPQIESSEVLPEDISTEPVAPELAEDFAAPSEPRPPAESPIPYAPQTPPVGVPRVNPPSPFTRPPQRPNLGRQTFAKGMGRHTFRPSGFRPPAPPPTPRPTPVEPEHQDTPAAQAESHAASLPPPISRPQFGAPRGNQLAQRTPPQPTPLAHGTPGVSGVGHRGPQVIARAPEPAPDTVPLPPVAEGTDLSETAALAPVPPADSAATPMEPQDAEAIAPFAEDIEIEEAAAPAKRREPTGRDMIINVAEGEEVRIAIVGRGKLEELYMERPSTESHVGNIYKGRVTNVEPSIQAAFIDFGIGKNGFLHISDLHPQYFSKKNRPKLSYRTPPKSQVASEQLPPGALPESAVPQGESEVSNPDVSNSDADETPDFGSAYNDEFSDDLEAAEGDVDPGIKPMERVGRKTPRRARPPIQQCLRRGQEVIVQVTKEGIGTKGPTLTSYISCPGRYLVMMPGMSALGVSRKIEDEEQRRELRKILLDLAPPKNLGFIIRTAGTDVSKRELQGDLNYLVRMWKVIANRIRSHRAPVELYQESDLVIRTIRDVFNDEIDRIIVDNEQVASRVRDFLSIVNPRSAGVVELYTGTLPIFQKYNVEREIEKIHSRRVEMQNGGSLVIDSAEALVAIDVNSGRYREQRDAELTAFNMNKEALKEVCRQLRLRDLGGVVVIDFIDMREEKHKREIERLLKEELKNDRAKTKVLRMSQFCMIEMTRQRVRPSLKRSIYMDCPHCHGSALIKTPESVSLDVMRRVAAATVRMEISRIDVRVHPTVSTFVLNRKRKQLCELEDRSHKRITITPDPNLGGDAIVIEAFDQRGILLNLVL
jgi:ribonuclease E